MSELDVAAGRCSLHHIVGLFGTSKKVENK
jgi:hypothetical protein